MSTPTASRSTDGPPRRARRVAKVRGDRRSEAVDPPAGAATRGLMELLAWVAAPWAALQWSGVLALLVLAVLVALPATFNVPGDKKHGGRPVSGPVRIGIELVLMSAGVLGAALVWPIWAAVAAAALTVVAFLLGLPRWAWLLRSTPAR